MSSEAESNKSLSLNNKIYHSTMAALLFVIVSLPQVYEQTNRFVSTISNNCPTIEGRFIHTLVFFVANYVMMKIMNSYRHADERKSDALMVKYAFYGTLLFFFISSRETYLLTGKLINGLSENGCPTIKGIVVHGLVFIAILVLMMSFPKDQ